MRIEDIAAQGYPPSGEKSTNFIPTNLPRPLALTGLAHEREDDIPAGAANRTKDSALT
jgi:hypothetical protein